MQEPPTLAESKCTFNSPLYKQEQTNTHTPLYDQVGHLFKCVFIRTALNILEPSMLLCVKGKVLFENTNLSVQMSLISTTHSTHGLCLLIID